MSTFAPAVEAEFNYRLPLEAGEPKPSFGKNPVDPTVVRHRTHPKLVHNGREIETSLDSEGFQLATHESRVKDFYDPHEIQATYYKEMEGLISRLTGATTVHMLGHLTRNEADAEPGKRLGAHRLVHSDFTPSLAEKLRQFIPNPELFEGRVAIFNLWRRFDSGKLHAPLAVCDASTVSPSDLLATDLHNYGGRQGFQLEIYQSLHNPNHSWFFFPEMERDEVLVFRTFDSAMDPFIPTLHSAFDDPECPENTPQRESIETRAICFFD
ncbi:MAG: CmcJ/NvfI family oxidoreductase [Myxococcota bacterium]